MVLVILGFRYNFRIFEQIIVVHFRASAKRVRSCREMGWLKNTNGRLFLAAEHRGGWIKTIICLRQTLSNHRVPRVALIEYALLLIAKGMKQPRLTLLDACLIRRRRTWVLQLIIRHRGQIIGPNNNLRRLHHQVLCRVWWSASPFCRTWLLILIAPCSHCYSVTKCSLGGTWLQNTSCIIKRWLLWRSPVFQPASITSPRGCLITTFLDDYALLWVMRIYVVSQLLFLNWLHPLGREV
jgi:hypothetical protein